MSLRFWGVMSWLLAFHVFAATNGGWLAQHPWLDVGSALLMFTVAIFMLSQTLSLKFGLSHCCVMFFILLASVMLTLRIYNQVPYPWYDLVQLMVAPQIIAMAIGFRLGTRQELADLDAEITALTAKH